MKASRELRILTTVVNESVANVQANYCRGGPQDAGIRHSDDFLRRIVCFLFSSR
jgi:hypothetical protein